VADVVGRAMMLRPHALAAGWVARPAAAGATEAAGTPAFLVFFFLKRVESAADAALCRTMFFFFVVRECVCV
jgi:hypothetical protein